MYDSHSFLRKLDIYSKLLVCSSPKLPIYRNVIITQTKVHRETQFLVPFSYLTMEIKTKTEILFSDKAPRISSPMLFNGTDGFYNESNGNGEISNILNVRPFDARKGFASLCRLIL